jgi:hypothetical protein
MKAITPAAPRKMLMMADTKLDGLMLLRPANLVSVAPVVMESLRPPAKRRLGAAATVAANPALRVKNLRVLLTFHSPPFVKKIIYYFVLVCRNGGAGYHM